MLGRLAGLQAARAGWGGWREGAARLGGLGWVANLRDPFIICTPSPAPHACMALSVLYRTLPRRTRRSRCPQRYTPAELQAALRCPTIADFQVRNPAFWKKGRLGGSCGPPGGGEGTRPSSPVPKTVGWGRLGQATAQQQAVAQHTACLMHCPLSSSPPHPTHMHTQRVTSPAQPPPPRPRARHTTAQRPTPNQPQHPPTNNRLQDSIAAFFEKQMAKQGKQASYAASAGSASTTVSAFGGAEAGDELPASSTGSAGTFFGSASAATATATAATAAAAPGGSGMFGAAQQPVGSEADIKAVIAAQTSKSTQELQVRVCVCVRACTCHVCVCAHASRVCACPCVCTRMRVLFMCAWQPLHCRVRRRPTRPWLRPPHESDLLLLGRLLRPMPGSARALPRPPPKLRFQAAPLPGRDAIAIVFPPPMHPPLRPAGGRRQGGGQLDLAPRQPVQAQGHQRRHQQVTMMMTNMAMMLHQHRPAALPAGEVGPVRRCGGTGTQGGGERLHSVWGWSVCSLTSFIHPNLVSAISST